MRKGIIKWGLILPALLITVGCASTTTDTTDSGSTEQTSSGGGESKSKAKPCTSKATEDCTPRVGPNNSVRVDALRWRVANVTTATNIGADEFTDGTSADGVFVIAKLKVHSYKKESAQLVGVDDLVSLKVGETKISPSTDGEVAYSIDNGGDADTLSSLDSISPGADKTITAVFDVPQSKLGRKMQLRFGELGFGQTEGFIRLPKLSA
jgi:hypothetical protein